MTRGAAAMLAGGALASLAMAASFAGAWSPALDLLAHFRVQLTAACGLFALLLAARRGSRFAAALPLVATLAGIVTILPLYAGPGGTARPGAARLTVLAHNTWGRSGEVDAVLAQVERSGAQLVFLQEMSEALRPEIPSLDGSFDVVSHRDNALLVATGGGDAFSVEDARPWAEDAWLGFDVRATLDGRPLRVLAVHLSSPRTVRGLERRDRQIEAIARWSAAGDGPQLVIGDLNTTPWAHGFRDLLQRTRLLDSTPGFGFQPTYPCFGPLGLSLPVRIPIDHALHTSELVTLERSIGSAAGSNHRPVRAVFAWRDARAPGDGG